MFSLTRTLAKPHQAHVPSQEPEAPPAPDIRDAIDAFVASRFKATEDTRKKYERNLRAFAEWCEAQGYPTDTWALSGKKARRFVQEYLVHLERQGIAPGTRNVIFRELRTFWGWCLEESTDDYDEPGGPPYYVRRSPVFKEDVPPDTPADDIGEPYSDDEVERMLAYIGPAKSQDLWLRRDRAIILTLWRGGLRRAEIAALTVGDYHSRDGTITVRNSVAKTTKRRDDARTTKLYNSALIEVNNYFARFRQSAKPTEPLFPSRQSRKGGRGLRPDSVSDMVGKTIRGVQANCKNLARHPDGGGCDQCIRFGADGRQTCHRFRSTWAVNMFRRGAKPQTVMKMGGWSRLDMPMRYTRHAEDELAEQDADRVWSE